MTALARNQATASARPATAMSALPQMVGSHPPPPLLVAAQGSGIATSRRPLAERWRMVLEAGVLRADRPSRLPLRLKRPPPPLPEAPALPPAPLPSSISTLDLLSPQPPLPYNVPSGRRCRSHGGALFGCAHCRCCAAVGCGLSIAGSAAAV